MVEGSEMLSQGVVSTDIAMVDRYREFYMNYLSMSGGTQWDMDMLVGSFQLRVIGESGVTKITNQDYLVSLQDGSGSYACDANELTIILSTDCTVRFMTNGGSEIKSQIVQFGEKIIIPETPVRDGFVFSGWYTDIHLTDEWDFVNDTVQGNMSLYAKWVVSDKSVDIQGDLEKSQCYLWWLLIILILLFIIFGIIEKRRKDKKNKK